MYPIVLHFSKFVIYSHGLLAAIGFLVGGIILWYLSRKEKLMNSGKNFDLFDFLLGIIILGIVGARLVYVALYYKEFNSFWDLFTIWNGGLVSFGGIAAALIFAILYLRWKKQNIWAWLDIGSIAFLAGWFFGRIGCFLAGDIPGKPIAASWAFNLSFLGQPPTQPVALYEALLVIILFMIVLILYQRKILDEGLVFIGTMTIYFLGRFVIDFWRNESIVLASITAGQIASLIIFIGFLILGFLKFRSSTIKQ